MNVLRSACGALLLLAFDAYANPDPAPDLVWLAGHWCGEEQPRVEEFWLPPVGGELHGLSRTIKQDGTGQERVVAFEFLRIAAHEGAPSYFAQPGGRPPTAFRRSAGGANWVRFENPEHDFPTRIEYRRQGDRLQAEIAGPDGAGGEQKIGFRFGRCGDTSQPTFDAPNPK